MNVNHTVCDECQRVKGASNHWFMIGVVRTSLDGPISLLLGDLDIEWEECECEYRDLCGEQCFYKHIGKLLRLNPTEAE